MSSFFYNIRMGIKGNSSVFRIKSHYIVGIFNYTTMYCGRRFVLKKQLFSLPFR